MTPADLAARAASILAAEGLPLVPCTIAYGERGHPAVAAGLAGLDPDTALPLYSVTKTVVATCILRLVATDRLDLDLPAAPLALEPRLHPGVTLRHLLLHRAGLPDYGANPAYHADLRSAPDRPWSRARFLDEILGPAATTAPGTAGSPDAPFGYANVGYLLLALVLERLHGLPLATVVRRETGLPVLTTSADWAGLPPGRPAYHPGWVSHGLAAATAEETAAFLAALDEGRLLPHTLTPLLRQGLDAAPSHPRFRRPQYGHGTMVDPDFPEGPLWGHSGGGPGYGAAAYVAHLSGRRAVVLLAAERTDLAEALALGLLRR